MIEKQNAYNKTITHGEAQIKAGDTTGAIATFQVAVDIDPHDGLALQRLAEAYAAKGQTDQALATYRTLLYPVPGQYWGCSNGNSEAVLMRFALLLQKAGYTQEALTAYNRGMGFLDYDAVTGQPREKVLLPQMGAAPGQEPYTQSKLEAMARLALAIETFGHEGYGDLSLKKDFQQAAEIAPDSAVAQYYLGKYLYGKSDPGAKAALERAAQLGDARTAAAAQEYLAELH